MWNHQFSINTNSSSESEAFSYSKPHKKFSDTDCAANTFSPASNGDKELCGNSQAFGCPDASKDCNAEHCHSIPQDKDTQDNPKTSSIHESPDSLKISSLSDSPLSGATQNESTNSKNFFAQVMKVEMQTSTMLSALCSEVDHCLIKNKETCSHTPKIMLVIFGYLGNNSFKKLEAGDQVKIFAPW